MYKPILRFYFFSSLFLFLNPSVFGQDLLTRQEPLPCLDKTFSVVAHIVRDSFGDPGITENQIINIIDAANPAFDPICVDFEVCEFRYIDNFQYNTLARNNWREMQVKYHVENRLNIYFIGLGGHLCGFANTGGITNTLSGGVAVQKSACIDISNVGGLVHHLGHYFGLLDTYAGNRNELVDGSNCDTAGDLVCDTPADPYRPVDTSYLFIDTVNVCRFVYEQRDPNGEWYDPDMGNYMSNFPSFCKCGFTHGQYLRMAETYLSGVNKTW